MWQLDGTQQVWSPGSVGGLSDRKRCEFRSTLPADCRTKHEQCLQAQRKVPNPLTTVATVLVSLRWLAQVILFPPDCEKARMRGGGPSHNLDGQVGLLLTRCKIGRSLCYGRHRTRKAQSVHHTDLSCCSGQKPAASRFPVSQAGMSKRHAC